MAVAKRMTKEELREDKVVTALKELGELAQENLRTIVIAAVVVVAAVVGWVVFQNGRAQAEENASLSLAQAQQLYFSGQYAQALTQFQTLESEYGSTRAAKLAPLFLGSCQLATGDAAAAEGSYRQLEGNAGGDPILRAGAKRGLGAALSDQGKMADAGSAFREAAQMPENPLAADDWMAAGSAFLAAGQFSEAAAAFQTVVDEFPSSPRAQEARVRAAEAKAGS